MRGLGPIFHMPTSPCTHSKLILSAKKVDYKAHMVLTPILAAPTPSYILSLCESVHADDCCLFSDVAI